MIWTFQRMFGMLFDTLVGQTVHALGGAPPVGRTTPWDGGRTGPSERHSVSTREPERGKVWGTKRRDEHKTDLQGDDIKLVEYALVSIRRGAERMLPGGSGQILVTGAMSGESFSTWMIATYLQSGAPPIPHSEKKYLRVTWHVLARWPREPLHFQEKQLDALEGIRDAVRDCCDGAPPVRERAGRPEPASAPEAAPAPAPEVAPAPEPERAAPAEPEQAAAAAEPAPPEPGVGEPLARLEEVAAISVEPEEPAPPPARKQARARKPAAEPGPSPAPQPERPRTRRPARKKPR